MKKPTAAPFLLFMSMNICLLAQVPLNTYFPDTNIRINDVTFYFKNLKTGYKEAQLSVEIWNAREEAILIKGSDIVLIEEQSERNPNRSNDLVVPPISNGVLNLTYTLDNRILRSFTLTIKSIANCKEEFGKVEELEFNRDTGVVSDHYQVYLGDRHQARSGLKALLTLTLTTDRLLEINHKNITASVGELKIIRHKKSGERPFYLYGQNDSATMNLFFPKVFDLAAHIRMKNVFKTYVVRPSTGFSTTFHSVPPEKLYPRKDIDKIE